MQERLVAVIPAHFSDLLATLDLLSLRYQSLAVVCIRAEQTIIVFDDYQLTITDQTVTAVDYLPVCCRNDGLTFLSSYFNPVPAGIIGSEIADDSATGGPQPAARVSLCDCGRLIFTTCSRCRGFFAA